MKSLLARLQRIFLVKFIMDVFARFGKDNGGLLAAGLAFFMVLAFVPMLLVGLYVLGHLYVHRPDEAVQKIYDLLSKQIVPGKAGDEVRHLMLRANIATAAGDNGPLHAGPTLMHLLQGHGIAGLIGVLSLAWAALQIFINGSAAMNAAWQTTEKRGWVKLRLVALGLLVAAGVLLVLSLAATGYSTVISASDFARSVPFLGLLLSGLYELAAVAVSAGMYAVIYKYLPSAQVTWKAAFVGGAFSAIAWEVAKKALAVYLLKPNHSLYGELGNLIVFILWVLYSMTILLLGAEASAVYAETVEGRGVAHLKRAAQATPSADAVLGSGSPLARSKERSRAERLRKGGRSDSP